jgi:hypothetical protein
VSLMEESVWQKMMHGLNTRRYSQVIQELEQAYGIKDFHERRLHRTHSGERASSPMRPELSCDESFRSTSCSET